MTVYQWSIVAFKDATGRWGARWETNERSGERDRNGRPMPKVEGWTDPTFESDSDARGHAMMWIARYEDALVTPGTPVETTAPRAVTDDDLVEALAAHKAQFTSDDVRLGG